MSSWQFCISSFTFHDVPWRSCHLCVSWRTHFCTASIFFSSPALYFIVLKNSKIFVKCHEGLLASNSHFPKAELHFHRKINIPFKLGHHFVEGMEREGGVKRKKCQKLFCVEQTCGKSAFASGQNLFQKKSTEFVMKDWGICNPNHIFKVLWSLTIVKRSMDS